MAVNIFQWPCGTDPKRPTRSVWSEFSKCQVCGRLSGWKDFFSDVEILTLDSSSDVPSGIPHAIFEPKKCQICGRLTGTILWCDYDSECDMAEVLFKLSRARNSTRCPPCRRGRLATMLRS